MALIWDRGPAFLNQHIFKVVRASAPSWDISTTCSVTRWCALVSSLTGPPCGTSPAPILLPFPVDLPPLPEQRQIAAILDTIDDSIRKTEQVIAKLKQVKQGLLHDLLTRGIDDNGELRDPERHPEQFKDSPRGRIPRGWEMWSLEACVRAPITPESCKRGLMFQTASPTSELGTCPVIVSPSEVCSGRPLELPPATRALEWKLVELSARSARLLARCFQCLTNSMVPTLRRVLRVLARALGINPDYLLWTMRGHAMQRQFDLSVKGTTFPYHTCTPSSASGAHSLEPGGTRTVSRCSCGPPSIERLRRPSHARSFA